VPTVNYGGEISGQVIDLRGLRPGYPQIKIWPVNPGTSITSTLPFGEPDDDDPNWGYGSLFLRNNQEIIDDIEAKTKDYNDKNCMGTYADRTKMPVIKYADFSFKMAKFHIDIDPNNPELRYIRYEPQTDGSFDFFDPNEEYYFRIRTKDTSSDSLNGMLPTDTGPFLEGCFPPLGYGSGSEDHFHERYEPVKVQVFSNNTVLEVELNNADKTVTELESMPNPWITEPTSSMKMVVDSGQTNFRLQVFASIGTNPASITKATLKYTHDDTRRSGTLVWDYASPAMFGTTLGYADPSDPAAGHNGTIYSEGAKTGKIFTFTATAGLTGSDGKEIFIDHAGQYKLTVTFYLGKVEKTVSYLVKMDGKNPTVYIRSVRGAYEDPKSDAVNSSLPNRMGTVNKEPYIVNGNIQVKVDSEDVGNNLMTYNEKVMGAGVKPPESDNYPMVKWIVEQAASATESEPTGAGTVLQKLRDYRDNPSAVNLQFFYDIAEKYDQPSTITIPGVSRTLLASGWVMRPIPGAVIDEDKANHFKINTKAWDGQDLWLYVITQDAAYNLGFTVQKIKVDQSTDKPVLDTSLYKENANDTPQTISKPEDLEVSVNYAGSVRSMSGNYSANRPQRNILVKDQGIELNFLDDDGINLNDVTITLTVLDPVSDIPGNKTVTLNPAQVREALRAGNKRDWSGVLTQKIMAEALYGAAASPGFLRDGMYHIKFEVKDDPNEKVVIIRNPNITGDNPPEIAQTIDEYWFAVFTEPPEIEVKYPDVNAQGSSNPMIIQGEVKSRLQIKSMWITFTPNVVQVSTTTLNPPSNPLAVPLTPVAAPDANGYYTYTWEYGGLDGKGVIFQPINPNTNVAYFPGDVRRFSVEAWDRLGNMSNVDRTVALDDGPPDVTLSDFNYGRPPDPDGKVYVYGKVSFTVSATDKNGLYEIDGKSGIKWWVIKSADSDPSWDTAFPSYTIPTPRPVPDPLPAGAPASWIGGGNFNLNQERNGGNYTGVIDTRYLPENVEHKLCIIAMDKAGNTSSRTIKVGGTDTNVLWYEKFIIDQTRDWPVIDPNSLDPMPDSVGKKGAIISGMISDADLFDVKKLNSPGYVYIRFPAAGVTVKPGTQAQWGDWKLVNIPSTYTIAGGGIDPAGAIVFKYNPPAGSAERNYLDSTGIKYYQILVSDEPDVGVDNKNYGKNPDTFMRDAPALYPAPYQYVPHNKVALIFPDRVDKDTTQYPLESYKFIVDGDPPVIYFDNYDPTVGHPNYTTTRPTFSKWEELRDALSGWVYEYKLSDMSFSWIAGDDIISKVVLNNPDNQTDEGNYPWDIKDPKFADLEAFFLTASQGMQIISFEATDMLGQIGRATWIFAKDTQGPDIIFNNIARSIKRKPYPSDTDFISLSPTWPSDWRYGGITWKGWTTTWINTIKYWPSEYAFFPGDTVKEKADKVIEALKKEDERLPSTVIGDPEGGNSPPVLRGTFSDEYSFVRQVDAAGNPLPTPFYYRFKDKNGNLRINNATDIPSGLATELLDGEIWIKKDMEPGQGNKSASWIITLDKTGGFIDKDNVTSLPDGEHWLDIKVADTAGNFADIYNVRFLVDRAPPTVGSYDESGSPWVFMPGEVIVDKIAGITWTRRVVPEDERVFSADGSSGGDYVQAFTIEGRVSDFNLSGLKIIIGQDVSTDYTVEASVEVDPSQIGINGNTTGLTKEPNDVVTGVADTTPQTRLKLTGPFKEGTNTPYNQATDTGTPEWVWTLEILNKDVAQLRAAAKTAADSARRYIRVSASDKAGKRLSVDWYFYLDTKKPTLDYTNLDTGTGTQASSFEDNRMTLSGLVSDDTKIRDVKYMIGKWVYGAGGGWRWWNGTAWTATSPIQTYPVDQWPSAFDKAGSPAPARPTPSTSMNWTINQATLDAATLKAETANAFENPATKKLFDQEGYYRLDICVTDYSLGSGNPHNTTFVDDPDFKDTGTYTVAVPGHAVGAANTYNGATGDGYRSARVFYIDKKDPTLRWGWFNIDASGNEIKDPNDTYNTTTKTYFKNDGGQAKFSFTVGDGNTIQEWSAKVTYTDPVTKEPITTLSTATGYTGLKWEASEKGATGPIPKPVDPYATPPNNVISDTATTDQKLLIAPFMTIDGTPTGQALDVYLGTLPTYTLTITATDGAGRTSTITKQFTLDNTPPRFNQEKFQPLSYQWGSDTTVAGSEDINSSGYTPVKSTRSYSYDAVTGRLNIRGNTEDNSNQIKRVAFYVPPAGTSTTYAFKNPADPTIKDAPASLTDEEYWHWQNPESPNNYKIVINGTTFLEIDGTFAWRIIVPQTSLFYTDSDARNYVQWRKTPSDKYQDVTFTRNATTGAVTGISTDSIEVPDITFPGLINNKIDNDEDVGLITVYVLAEDAAGNISYDLLKYWIWPEGDRPIVTAINNPDRTKVEAERLLNGSIRISGMAKDNERVNNVWFRILDATGKPYTNLQIPVWDETTWEAKTPSAIQTAKPGLPQPSPSTLTDIGSLKSTDSLTKLIPNPVNVTPTSNDGWYMANGGGSPLVSWYAYINTNGELDPQGAEESRRFIVEVRAQDVTWDDSMNGNEGGWKLYTNTYKGMVSTSLAVDAWVVAGAPIFEEQRVASEPSFSDPEKWDEKDPTNQYYKYSLDRMSIRNRSSYKVTVKHNSGLSAIRWSPTVWTASGGFQTHPTADSYNLMDLKDGYYVYWDGTKFDATKDRATIFADMDMAKGSGAAVPRMAVTVKPPEILGDGVSATNTVTLLANRQYLVWKWDIALESTSPPLVAHDDTTHWEPGTHNPLVPGSGTHKDLKNTIIPASTLARTVNIGKAILIESTPETVDNKTVHYFKWNIIVDVRADLLLADLPPAYENITEGRYRDSVHYPVYLSASEVSRATPLTTRGDTLLPIDNLPPKGIYTLNRKPAGSNVAIGGEAGDDGPVSGVARVVLWFQRETDLISWHELPVTGGLGGVPGKNPTYTDLSNPAWWQDESLKNKDGTSVIPTTSAVKKPNIGAETLGTGGDYAIVVDRNSPTTKQSAWGHQLTMGFAEGGMGKHWYVEINSYGITSGPVDLHYVVIDKAGNAKYYKERLVIMNDAAVIYRIKLATDIRHYSAWPAPLDKNNSAHTGKSGDPLNASTILDAIRSRVGQPTDVQNGISDWVSATALGATNIIDFNVRNKLFALRVETTAAAGTNKDRHFRLEYVSNVTLLANTAPGVTPERTQLPNMKAGRIYIIDDPGNAKWGAIGADGEGPWPRGYAFLAVIDGTVDNDVKITGTGSAWEVNTSYYTSAGRTVPSALQIPDVPYEKNPSGKNEFAKGAEFVYANTAFDSAVGTTIVDYGGNDEYPGAGVNLVNPPTAADRQSMFVIKVFDGDEEDTFGDFAILRIRVNNDDKTKPFAQVYDINPKTEGQDRQNIASNEEARSLAPMFIGEGTGSNRTKGGLWNTAPTLGAVTKPGHIEPRRMEGTNYGPLYSTKQTGESAARRHSLSSAQMGGAATIEDATIQKPWANPDGFFNRDTVSGKVVLRGYAEDDQRIAQIVLTIGGTTDTDGTNITILDFANNVPKTDYNPATYTSPRTGLLQIPDAQKDNVYYADSIDAYRHRVEWAYIWDTEKLNSTVVGDNVRVWVRSYNRNGVATTGTIRKTVSDNIPDTQAGIAHSSVSETTKPNTSPFNPGFPVGMNKYNRISFNQRPYITGFKRNQATFAHDTRSRQGRYMFARNETAVVTGFNLQQGANNAVISLPGAANIPTGNVGTIGNYGITAPDNMRYREFTVGGTATSSMDSGVITLTVNSIQAVNAGSDRKPLGTPTRPLAIQPWNIEYSPGRPGTELWDDFTQAHIWQSNSNTGVDGGRFTSTNNWVILNPAMSIDPNDGVLYESHNESGSGIIGNTGTTRKSPITNTNITQPITQFVDPVFFSDVYRSPGGGGNGGLAAETWAVSSIIGRSSNLQSWRALGGIYISGDGGAKIAFTGGGGTQGTSAEGYSRNSSLYLGESTWFNASSDNGSRVANPATTDQFLNPHIVTSYTGTGSGTREHIHVSYYDDKDHSIKYRYNLRGRAGVIDVGGSITNDGARYDPPYGYNANNVNTYIPKMWTNLDGGVDLEDTDATMYTHTDVGPTNSGSIPQGARVVRNGTRAAIDAGKHNSIAVTSEGYPVIAYYDQTNQRLKLAVSNSTAPVLAANWIIRDFVIPEENPISFGTGEFVSMKIDTQNGTKRNRVHIAAMNTKKQLVYVTGTVNPTFTTGNTQQTTGGVFTFEKAQVVDDVGNVGRWCALSLDKDGNPWISYMDESYVGARDGAKMAFLNTTTFYKGVDKGTDSYCKGQYIDRYGESLEGWETMHVPTTYRVVNPVEGSGREHGRLGMECWPTRTLPNVATNRFWIAAISYLSQDAENNGAAMDRYRVAYYVK